MAETSTALAVRVCWGSVRVASQLLVEQGARRFSVGPGDDDVTARGGRVGFFVDGDGPHLVFTEGLSGELVRNGETPLSLSEVVHEGLAEETAAGWVVALGRLDVARLSVGSLVVEAFPVRAPKRVAAAPELDFRFLNTLLSTVLLAVLAVVSASFGSEEELDEEPPPSTQHAVLRRVLTATPPPPVRRASREQEPTKSRERMKERVAEAGRPKRSASPPSEGRRMKPIDLKRVFGDVLGPGAGNVLAGGSLGDDLTQAMGGVVGASDGFGGWAARGNGAGGDVGGPSGIGSIGVKHGTWGHDVVLTKLVGPPLPEPEPTSVVQICDGSACLDKEMVRRVIRSHLGQVRYCYESELRASPTLTGKVAVRFHVAAAGPVDRAEVAQSTVPGTRLPDCLVGRVRTWVFPRTPGGFTVTYPFHFAPAGQ